VPALSGSRVMATTERTYKHINTSLYRIRLSRHNYELL